MPVKKLSDLPQKTASDNGDGFVITSVTGQDMRVPFQNLRENLSIDDIESNIQTLQANQTRGFIGYETKSAMDFDTTQADGTIGFVTNDPTASNNGYYRWDASLATPAWVKKDNFYATTLDPAGTSEAVTGKAVDDHFYRNDFPSFERLESGATSDTTSTGTFILKNVFQAIRYIRLEGVDPQKKYRVSFIQRNVTGQYGIDIEQQQGDGTWVRVYFRRENITENADAVTRWDFYSSTGAGTRLVADIEWWRLSGTGSDGVYPTDATSFVLKNEAITNGFVTDPDTQESPSSKRYGIDLFPCFVRYKEGSVDVSTTAGKKYEVYSAFKKLEIFGSDPSKPHKIYFLRRNVSNTWRFIINRLDSGTWTKIYDGSISGLTENANGTTSWRASNSGVVVHAEIDWRYMAEGTHSVEAEIDDPIFVINSENIYESLSLGVFTSTVGNLTSAGEAVSKIIKRFELYNADESLLYSIRFLTRDNATHGSRIIITSSSDGGTSWSDYIDFDYDTVESVDGDLITVDTLVDGYKGVRLTLDQKFIFEDLNSPTDGDLILNPEFVTNYAEQKELGAWTNIFPNALSKVDTFRQKLLNRNDDLYISIYGDSLTAQHNKTAIDGAENRPPQLTNKNWIYFFWQRINDIEVIADRYDSAVNAFTETGTGWTDSWSFFDSGTMSNYRYDDRKEDGALTRYTNDSNASVSFDWNLDTYDKAHFIYRRDIRGVSSATISVSGGNGNIELWDGTSWVEANGFVIDMSLTGTQGEGETLGNWRLKMRKSATGSLNQTVTVSKGANTDYLFYWGVERWNGNSIFLTNIARGGLNTVEWSYNVQGELARLTDFVICQLPLINEYGDFRTNTQTIIDNQQDFIWGDRAGNLNANSLKNLSNDWADFQALAVIPHHRKDYLNGDQYDIDYLNDGADAPTNIVWSRVKALIDLKGELDYIPVDSAWDAEAKTRSWNREESYAGSSPKDITAFTMDTAHQNDLGSKIWARYITPIFR